MQPSKRNAPSTVRLTEREREIIDLAATAEGRDRSQYMRFHALEAARARMAAMKAGVAEVGPR